MERRKFVKTTGGIALSMPLVPMVGLSNNGEATSDSVLKALVKVNDEKVQGWLTSQLLDENHRWFGGSPNRYGIPNATTTTSMVRCLSCALVSPGSDYYGSEELIMAITRATNYLLNVQYEDGTVDLHTTNFHSTPDTAFRVEPLILSYDLLSKSSLSLLDEVLSNLERFLENAGKALTIGGIHTPNHRWVVCMALAHIHRLFPNQGYLDRIDQWLAESIDIDPDGQFTEKSTTVYSPLVDRCLITMARLLSRPDLYEPVRKNLEMTLYYVRPNLEVSTETSGRQDRYRVGTVANYHYPYRYMAIKDGNGQFAEITNRIETNELPKITPSLIHLLQDPFLRGELPKEENIPTDYVKYFKHAKLLRIRRGTRDATVIADNPVVFSYFKGSAALIGLRIASAFFGKGQFQGDEIEINDNRYTLGSTLKGPYYQPLKEGEFHPEIDNFGEQRKKRVQSEVQTLNSAVVISEDQGTFEILIDIKGTDHVPVAIELGFRQGGTLEGVEPIAEMPDSYLFNKSEGKYHFNENTITFGPGSAAHQWTNLRGALPKMDGLSVYLTGYTPFSFTLTVS